MCERLKWPHRCKQKCFNSIYLYKVYYTVCNHVPPAQTRTCAAYSALSWTTQTTPRTTATRRSTCSSRPSATTSNAPCRPRTWLSLTVCSRCMPYRRLYSCCRRYTHTHAHTHTRARARIYWGFRTCFDGCPALSLFRAALPVSRLTLF